MGNLFDLISQLPPEFSEEGTTGRSLIDSIVAAAREVGMAGTTPTLRKTHLKRLEGVEYDEILEVRTPTYYCLKKGKLIRFTLEVYPEELSKHEKKLFRELVEASIRDGVPDVYFKGFGEGKADAQDQKKDVA